MTFFENLSGFIQHTNIIEYSFHASANVPFVFIVLENLRQSDETKEEEDELFAKYYTEWKGVDHLKHKSYKTIPKFYFKVCSQFSSHILLFKYLCFLD